MIITGRGCQVYAVGSERHGIIGTLAKGRLHGCVNGSGVGSANGIGLFQHIAQIAGSRNIGGIYRPGLVANSNRDRKCIGQIRPHCTYCLAGLCHGHIAHMNAIDKHAGIDDVAIHIGTVLLVGRHRCGVILQQFAIDKGEIGKIPPEKSGDLRHHHNAKHQHARQAQRNDGGIAIGFPAAIPSASTTPCGRRLHSPLRY